MSKRNKEFEGNSKDGYHHGLWNTIENKFDIYWHEGTGNDSDWNGEKYTEEELNELNLQIQNERKETKSKKYTSWSNKK